MNFTSQGRKLSSNAQLLLMSVHEQEKPKFDTAVLDRIALNKSDDEVPLVQEKRGRGRPRKNPIEQTESIPDNDVPLVQEKRGRGRPRKNPIEQTESILDNDVPLVQENRGRPRKIVELEIKTELKENDILDIKEKLKLLETITNGYKEIERLDKETQKNVEKLCAMIHNSK